MLKNINECVLNPRLPECVDYRFPVPLIEQRLDSLCSSMEWMPGCLLRTICSHSQANTEYFCQPFQLWADVCSKDMPKMDGCQEYSSLCSSDSLVRQCRSDAPLSFLPTTKEAYGLVRSICDEMDMPGCDSCHEKNCAALVVYAQLCVQMPDMMQCKQFSQLCNAEPSLPICFADSDDSNRPVTMKMFFHFGIRDYILFESLVPQSLISYAFACGFSLVLAILYEYLVAFGLQMEAKWLQLNQIDESVPISGSNERASLSYSSPAGDRVRQRTTGQTRVGDESSTTALPHSESTDSSTPLITDNNQHNPQLRQVTWTPLRIRVARAAIRFVTITTGYLCMLLAMTYNVGIFLSVVVGVALGSFIFSPANAVNKDHCC